MFTGDMLLGAFREVRAATEALAAPLSPEDCQIQAMPDVSPPKWHLAHTSWFFETFVLAKHAPGYRPFHPAFVRLFNSYYEAVGEYHPRPERGLLTRPSLDGVRAYRRHVDAAMQELLSRADAPRDALDVTTLGLHHERQHQELLLTDTTYNFFMNPLRPAYREATRPFAAAAPAPLGWVVFPEGLRHVGHQADGFAFDNEGPRHPVYLRAFALADRLVTNAEWREFVDDGGYERAELWLSDGWAKVRAAGWRAPLYWERRDGDWYRFTLEGMVPLAPDVPASHVSYYEADAYARWAGARLPTEEEWEVAAADAPVKGNFVESGALRPLPVAGPTRGRTASGCDQPDDAPTLCQLFGDVWEWTQSPYRPYPGYRPPAGALGEYNGKFMCSQMVLRGGSCFSAADHVRATYRNFFPPDARWQVTGVRLARDH